MFEKIPGNVLEDSVEYSRWLREVFEEIPGNLILGLLCKTLLVFFQICNEIATNNGEKTITKNSFERNFFYFIMNNLKSLIAVLLSFFFHLSFCFILVYLIALPKFQNVRGASHHSALRSYCLRRLSPMSSVNGLLLV